jgi:hypothetical protein
MGFEKNIALERAKIKTVGCARDATRSHHDFETIAILLADATSFYWGHQRSRPIIGNTNT